MRLRRAGDNDSVRGGDCGRNIAGPMAEKRKHPLLIVDDEPEVLASLRSMFRRDYHVHAANRAEEALALLRTQEVHVVVSDQRMPGMSGTEFLARVRAEFPDVIRLMITGYADIESVIDAINRGNVYRYISKPWDPAELESIVRQAVDQYELVADRRRLLKELEDKNQLKTAFITIASHELNTPLAIALGMLQLGLAKNQDEAVAVYLQRSYRAARRLQSLLSNTFKLLQQENFDRAFEKTAVRCHDLIAEIRQDLEPFIKLREQRLEIDVEPPELEVKASRIHLHDVLENLITNAIKFSPDGATVNVSARPKDGAVQFQVIDRGIGIAWEDQPHVFEPFFSTLDTLHHSTGEYGFCKRGIGLGLAIVKKFIEMHGGGVDFETTPGQGSTFRFTVPAP